MYIWVLWYTYAKECSNYDCYEASPVAFFSAPSDANEAIGKICEEYCHLKPGVFRITKEKLDSTEDLEEFNPDDYY